MAIQSIDPELQAILDAIYGEEVRTAIHDAIQKAYNLGQTAAQDAADAAQDAEDAANDAAETLEVASQMHTGPQGPQGVQGIGVDHIVTDYAVSISGTEVPTVNWQNTIPEAYPEEYIWTRFVIHYTDDTASDPFYTVSRQGTSSDATRILAEAALNKATATESTLVGHDAAISSLLERVAELENRLSNEQIISMVLGSSTYNHDMQQIEYKFEDIEQFTDALKKWIGADDDRIAIGDQDDPNAISMTNDGDSFTFYADGEEIGTVQNGIFNVKKGSCYEQLIIGKAEVNGEYRVETTTTGLVVRLGEA